MSTYSRHPVALTSGHGPYVRDADGKQYLDFIGGLAVNALGHCHPAVVEAITRQCGSLIHCSNLFWTEPQVELAQLLVEISGLERVFFCNSGTEANEAAIKLARRYAQVVQGSGRYKIISMSSSFHGRTIAAATATSQEAIHSGFDPLPGGFVYVPFNDAGALAKTIDAQTCAVILEPVQGEGGVNVAEPGFLREVERLCRENDVLLMMDEIQCGMGRTGKMFAYEHSGIKPDVVTLAKALGGGLPLGAVLASEEVSRAFGPGSHGSTFGGNPVACAAAVAVLETLQQDDLIANAETLGAYLMEKLTDLKDRYGFVRQIRGRGLMLGMQLEFPCADVVDACREKGLLINCAAKTVLRFLPPLNIESRHVDEALAVLDGVLSEIEDGGTSD